jgi:hypothetical protein
MSFGYVKPSTGFTIELWFKRDAIESQYQTLVTQRTQASVNWPTSGITVQGRQFAVEMSPTTGAIGVSFFNESINSGMMVGSWSDPSGGGYANDNQWHHFALRMATNKQTYSVFIDGEKLIQKNTNEAVNWKPGFLTFGANYSPSVGNWGSYIWNDWLAYFAVYEKPLTDNRIFEHYTAGAGGTVYYGDNEVTRLTRIADWAEVPDQSREFDSPVTTLQGIQVDGTNALGAFQETATSTGGLVFADGQSRLVYHNRRRRYNKWSAVTLSESLQAAPEVGITFTVDDENIYNDIRGERPFGSTVRIVDEVSKAAHGRKTYSFSIAVTSHAELENAVYWVAAQYRYPKVRISEVEFRAESSELIEWVGTGGVTIGDHITLAELPTDAAPEGTMEFIVEKVGLDVDIRNRVWTVRMQLSPYEINRVFRVGSSSLGSEDLIGY